MPNGDTSMTYPYPYKTQDGDDQIVGINSFNIGATTTLAPGSAATVHNAGTTEDLVLYFGIPAGLAASVTVGSTATLPYSSSATVTNSGNSAAAILNFGIPQGEPGSTSYDAGTLEGFTWAVPSALGTTTPNAATFSSLSAAGVNGSAGNPTLSFGLGGGAGASGTVVGSSTSGLLIINTGAAPAASANVVTVTFSSPSPYSKPPAVVVGPASAATASMAIASFLHPTTTTTSFTLVANTTGLVAVTTFSFYYIVMG